MKSFIFTTLALAASVSAQSSQWGLVSVYKDQTCKSSPSMMISSVSNATCQSLACTAAPAAMNLTFATSLSCASDPDAAFAAGFGSASYVQVDAFAEGSNCASGQLLGKLALLADGSCVSNFGVSYKASVNPDGSFTVVNYENDSTCTTATNTTSFPVAQANTCINGTAIARIHGAGIAGTNGNNAGINKNSGAMALSFASVVGLLSAAVFLF